MLVRPMLLHRMALVSVRLFCKNLGDLQEFVAQMVYRPPGKKLPVRLCFPRLFEIQDLISVFKIINTTAIRDRRVLLSKVQPT